jgi:hypothetical protein
MSWKRAKERIREREKRLLETPIIFDCTPDPGAFAALVAEHLSLLTEQADPRMFH